MLPELFYFDMGNVLLRFSHERMADQMARVAGIDSRRVWNILFEEGLHWAFERGEVTREQFYGRFCEAAGCRADIERLEAAGNDIFDLNSPIVGLVGKLVAAGHRLGVCSNTTVSHWSHCTSRFGILKTMFQVQALSYRLGVMKPDPKFFVAAAKLVALPPQHLWFADDRPDNVTAARAAGWDAVQYESVSQINEVLRSRGVVINY
jgi:glucose-1-phosphatase